METALGFIFGLAAGFSVGLVLAAFIGYFVIKRKLVALATNAGEVAKSYAMDVAVKQLKKVGTSMARGPYVRQAEEEAKRDGSV